MLEIISRIKKSENKLMFYSEEELKEIFKIMTAFSDYIEENENFEIMYSEKRGMLIHLSIYEEAECLMGDYVETPDDLFTYLVNEIIDDVRELNLAGEHFAPTLLPVEVEEAKRRLEPYLAQFSKKSRKGYEELLEELLDGEVGE